MASLALALLLGAAAAESWEPVGYPGGGLFPVIAIDPARTNVLYLGSDVSGAYKSVDHGDTWAPITFDLPSRTISDLVVDPGEYDRIWACTPLGLYKNEKSAAAWTPVNKDIQCYVLANTESIAISGATMLVVSNEAALPGDPFENGYGTHALTGKLYRSRDGGSSWRVVTGFPRRYRGGTRFPSVRFDPYVKGQAFLMADGYGILRSTDEGATWTDFSAGLPSARFHGRHMAIGRNTIYATAYDYRAEKEPASVFKSAKNKAAWVSIVNNLTPEDPGLAGASNPIYVSPMDDDTAYVGWTFDNGEGRLSDLAKTSNGGGSWQGLSAVTPANHVVSGLTPYSSWADPVTAPIRLAMDPGQTKRMYLTNWFGLWRSDDGGLTWREKVKGAQNTCCTDLAFSGGALLSAHMDTGVNSGSADGAAWAAAFPKKRPALGDWQHAWDLETGADGRIYAALGVSRTPAAEGGPRVLRSSDDGASYVDKSKGLERHGDAFTEIRLGADPHHAGTLYAVDNRNPNVKGHGGLFVTKDFAEHWRRLDHQPGSRTASEDRLLKVVAVDTVDPRKLYVGTYWDGLWYSHDRGLTWNKAAGSGPDGPDISGHSVQEIAARPDGTVWAAMTDGLYKSADGGRTFAQVFSDPSLGESNLPTLDFPHYLESVAFDPDDPQNIFISSAKTQPVYYNQGHVWRSTDGGKSWSEISRGLPVKNVRKLVCKDGYLYAAVWCANVYRLKIR